jgi:hypothetical protein
MRKYELGWAVIAIVPTEFCENFFKSLNEGTQTL